MTNFLRVRTAGYAETPDHASLDVAGDIDIRVAVALIDWTPASVQQDLVTKHFGTGANQASYAFAVRTDNMLLFRWSTDGAAMNPPAAVSTVAPTVADRGLLAVRMTFDADNGAGQNVTTFYTKTTTPTTAAADVASDTGWTQLGATVTQAGVVVLANTPTAVRIGCRSDGGNQTNGSFYTAVIKSGINGTTVANPDFTAQPIGIAPFDDGAGRTWTPGGDALITTNLVAIGLVTETDTVFPIINSVTVAIGLVTELDKVTTIVPRAAADPTFRLLLGVKLVTLGCGSYQCFVTRRGGSPVVLEVAFSQIQIQKVIDNAGTCTVSLPEVSGSSGAACCEVVEKTEPWRDELVVYRDRDIAFVGPVVTVDGDGGTLIARDLFHWMEKRFIEEDLHYWGDVAYTFREVFLKAMEKDTSPNIEDIIVHPTGVDSIRDYKGQDVLRAADLLRELARTAVDFTMVERTLYVGGKEVFAPESVPGTPLLLPDQAVLKAGVVKDGDAFATDVAVFAGSGEGGRGGKSRSVPLVGRATRQTDVYGLVQAVATELLISDLESANQNALSRLESMQPAPLRVHVVFSPDAPFEFKDIIPGRRVDSRLSATSCIDVIDTVRLANVNIGASAEGETIEGDLIPLGEFENA